MARRSNNRWLQRQENDPYIKEARVRGLRSRAAFKLEQIDQRYHFLHPGMRVLDLGAAPGSWSEYLILKYPDTRVLAVDIQAMKALPNVHFIKMDIYDTQLDQSIQEVLGDKIDLVVSDIAPHISGIKTVDMPRMLGLSERVVEIALKVLKKKGVLVTKVFQGEGFEGFYAEMKKSFRYCEIIKPKASRPESREVYFFVRHPQSGQLR